MIVYIDSSAAMKLLVDEKESAIRGWFGSDAGQPGTAQYVELVPGQPHWQMRPASAQPSGGGEAKEDVN